MGPGGGRSKANTAQGRIPSSTRIFSATSTICSTPCEWPSNAKGAPSCLPPFACSDKIGLNASQTSFDSSFWSLGCGSSSRMPWPGYSWIATSSVSGRRFRVGDHMTNESPPPYMTKSRMLYSSTVLSFSVFCTFSGRCSLLGTFMDLFSGRMEYPFHGSGGSTTPMARRASSSPASTAAAATSSRSSKSIILADSACVTRHHLLP
mmetsp:Transcript_46416/g.131264  ORF Transcript_46416/g.131264 Transcript_46416/m.131264 type:complete len:206 (-) Transcript_46416:32-649(-)